MDVKKLIWILAAVVVALAAAFGVLSILRGSAAPEARAAAAPERIGPKIIIATRPLPVGTILTAEALRYQPWPEGLVRADQYFVEGASNIAALTGSVVRVAMSAGTPITRGSLVNPGDRGFLAAALGPGMRAVTVPMSADQGVAGFVFPGDRVDLLLSQEIEGGDGEKLNTAETIVRNLRVLAVDQRTTPAQVEGSTTPIVFSTVTLEATPRIAETIAVARTSGTISLSLRSIADSAGELEAAIAAGNVNVGRDGDRTAEARLLAGNDRRPEAGTLGATTGGDISRYLPRSVPSKAQVAARQRAQAAAERAQMQQPAPPPYPAAAPRTAGPPVEGGVQNVPTGPVVRVTRGDQVTVVPVRGN